MNVRPAATRPYALPCPAAPDAARAAGHAPPAGVGMPGAVPDAFEPAVGAARVGGAGEAAPRPAYALFGPDGRELAYDDLLAAAKQADVVLFGELHDDPIGHWLELELARDLQASRRGDLVLGAEMLERDGQTLLDEYLAGLVSPQGFKDQARLWPNHATDYAPLVDLARATGVPFVATNVPRRYANIVYKQGVEALEGLGPEAKGWMAPLPFPFDPTLGCYADIIASSGGHGGENLAKAQALKDATMAHFILGGWRPGKTFLHFNGSYHSDNHEGIAWYLARARPELKILTIGSVRQPAIGALDPATNGRADFVLVTPESMTRTH